ncbi:C39 family peptidase [Vibrio sp.]|uniref:C39 family peptidase n=1 Tax=Vibrio sp. TaxID=678 RepID=UPI003D0B4258
MKTLEVPYKSQLDNEFNPGGACNVTSLAMCLEYLGARRKTDLEQFEDELYSYAENNGYSRHSPYDLTQIARDYGVDSHFEISGNIENIKRWIDGGNPNIIHGYFTDFGHIIVVVGYDEKGFVVHDPYGEWFASGYRNDLSGAYLHYSYNLIRRVCMPDGNLWTHYLKQKAT